jgi:hypothetical protein
MRSMSSATAALSRAREAPRRRFSSTDSAVKVPRPSGTWATPMRTTSSVLRPTTSWPSMRVMLPVVRTVWHRARSVVVLPAPLAPRMVVILPLLEREVDVRTAPAWTVEGVEVLTSSSFGMGGRPSEVGLR